MVSIIKFIDSLTAVFGKFASWLTSLLVLVICVDVFLRYNFSNTKVWIIELEWHLFALIFLLGAAFALQHDKHVRVDVFYQNFSPRKKAWINLIGILVFLMPWCFVIIKTGLKYAENSFFIMEGSPNPGGLPARFVIKGAIAFGFFLLLLQGISQLLKNIEILKSDS